ncbi:UNVERIFIED_CONTAM: AAA domain-containing protein [Acetivibrio alkalicellulosi]
MVIERLFIDAFGKFKKTEVKLNTGVNVIFGANESGKTTLMWFIISMLYSLRGRNNVNLYKKYMPWNGNEFKGRMEYFLDNGTKFFIQRDFVLNSVKVFDCFMTDISSSFDQSRERGCLFAKKHLGINQSCFERTAFIGQMDMKVDSNNKSEILNKLVNINQTGVEDISLNNAKKVLKETLLNYVGTDKTTTRPLDLVNAKLQDLEKQQRILIDKRAFDLSVDEKILSLKNVLNILERTKTSLDCEKILIEVKDDLYSVELKKSIGEIIHCKKEMFELIEKMDKLIDTRKIYDDFSNCQSNHVDDVVFKYRKKIDLLKINLDIETKLSKLKKQIISIESYLEELKFFNNLEENIEDTVKEILEFIDSSTNEKEKNQLGAITKSVKKYVIKKRLGQIGIIVSLIGIISGVLRGLNGHNFVLSFIFTAITLTLIYGTSYISKHLKALIVTREELSNIIQNTNNELSKKRKNLNDIYVKAQVKTIEHLLKKKALYNEKVLEFTATNSKIDSFEKELESNLYIVNELDQEIVENLVNCKIMCNKEKLEDRHIEMFKDGVKIFKETENSIIQLNEKIKSLKKYIESLYEKAIYICSSELNHMKEAVRSLDSQDEELDKIERQIEELSDEKKRLEEIAFSINMAIETLEESSVDIKKNNIPYLSKKTSEIMGKITKNRYSDIKSDANLILKTMCKETGNIVDVSMLSIGTIDQVYLALRLALVQLIERDGEKLPIIMDEIFAYFDDSRIENTIKLLNELMDRRQVIIFTCKKREVEWLKYGCGNQLNILELS